MTDSSTAASAESARWAPEDPFGYLLVHFVEDPEGYAEKIFLDLSRGDDPEKWDRLNGGAPVLASSMGTTGIRDPFLAFNPKTRTYYLIATDLRVWDGDFAADGLQEWAYWSRRGSTRLNVWSSTDLITWSEQSQLDVALDTTGARILELGMAWAPKAIWVDDFEGAGGRFVFTWSSNLWPLDDPGHTGATYSRVLWATTTDFSAATYEFGGVFVDIGANVIDTAVIQDSGTTYRITKDNATGMALYMESTTHPAWWRPDAEWVRIQTLIGAEWTDGNGHVEGPAVFKSHSDDVHYLYVDVIPSGYRPMWSRDLAAGWAKLDASDFALAPFTKHGNVISLTRREYGALRAADAFDVINQDLGAVDVVRGSSVDELRAALPKTAAVLLSHGGGRGELAIDWALDGIDPGSRSTAPVSGIVRSIGANANSWVGDDGSQDWDAAGKRPLRASALSVTATVSIVDPR